MDAIPFIKMHGLGNDFVVVDDRTAGYGLGAAEARVIGDRRTGIGFDQLLIMEKPTNGQADVFMRIRNPDGSEAEACGNGTRCVAAKVMGEIHKDEVIVETVAGLLPALMEVDGRFTVDMGPANTDWDAIPLARETDTLLVDVGTGALQGATAVNIGNPHAVFFVGDADSVPLEELGPLLEHDPMFPERANIEVAAVTGENRLRMRVWERGAGITRACGSGACATAVAAHRRGLTDRIVDVRLDGGLLSIEWREADGHVMMTGPVAVSFSGHIDRSLFAEIDRG